MPPIKTDVQYLPFEQLSWEKFEELCLSLVTLEFAIENTERYGTPGQKQDGIDIYALDKKDGKYVVCQCKKYTKFQKSDINKAIIKFQNGKFYNKSKKLILCTACELNSTAIQDEFEEQKVKLINENIELIKWDKVQISRILKNHPEIVLEFFGAEWTKRFNGKEAYTAISNAKVFLPDTEIQLLLNRASSDLLVINNNFEAVQNSHIERMETADLYEWIYTPLTEESSNIAVLAGNAGTGKTVICKDLLDLLVKDNIPVLGLKADRKQLDPCQIGKSVFGQELDIFSLFQKLLAKYKVVVLMIDQIDALSQSLSTNGQQLNIYTSLINQISTIKGVRIIVSCRIFDLHHDAQLKQYTNKKEVTLSLLTDSEVEAVIKQLTGKGLELIPKELIILLQTPLHLDIFCRIYIDIASITGINSLQDLYRNLWNQKMRKAQSKANIEPYIIKTLLYNIAECIYAREENLSAPSTLFEDYNIEIAYLKSENIIVESNGRLQFFHQSFYDYTYARNFVEKKEGNLLEFLQKQHQGLFVRSLIKQVLSYLRYFDFKQYIKQLNEIIFSIKVRYHIKLLVVEQLAFEFEPKAEEFVCILSLCSYNENLATSFFDSIPSISWFKHFIRKRQVLINLLNTPKRVLQESVSKFIVFSANIEAEKSIQVLLDIDNVERKNSLIKWTLYRITDFSSPFITQVYFSIEKELKNDSEKFHVLRNAIRSNPEFAIHEAIKAFRNELPAWKDKRRHEYSSSKEGHEFFRFCEDFYKKNPLSGYELIKEIVFELIKQTIFIPTYRDYNIIKIDSAFQDYDPNTYKYHKYLDWLVDMLNKRIENDKDFVRTELISFLRTNYSTCIQIALQIYKHNSSLFLNDIFEILINKDLAEDCLDIADLDYWYRCLFGVSYPLFSEERRLALNEFILSFYGAEDIMPDRGYKKKRDEYNSLNNKLYPYQNWRYNQWKLLNSLPFEIVNQYDKLRIRRLELNRRFAGWTVSNTRPFHGTTMAPICGGLLSAEKYKKLTLKQWHNSFIRYDKDYHSFGQRYFSVDEHAKAFGSVIKEQPRQYYPFILELIIENNVNIRYQICGIEGLIESKFDINKVRSLYGILMTREIPASYIHSFIRLSKVFIVESTIDDDLLDFWKMHALASFVSTGTYALNEQDEGNDKLFSDGWRSKNAEALMLLVNLSYLDAWTSKIFEYLLQISESLPTQLKLVVLYEINFESHFSEEQILKLFFAYSEPINSEIFHIAGELMNHLFFGKFEMMIPFINQSISLPKAAKYLGAYLLYGWFYGYEESKDLLLELHQSQTIAICESINQASRYCHDMAYRDKCLFILNRYANDSREEVMDAFSSGFLHFNSKDFLLVKNIIMIYIRHSRKTDFHCLLHYLMKCTKDYPVDCLEIQKIIGISNDINNSYEMRESVQLITQAYNTLRNNHSQDVSLDYAMDVFDEFLQIFPYKTEIDSILKDIDN